MRRLLLVCLVVGFCGAATGAWALFGGGRTFQNTSGPALPTAHPVSITPTTGTLVDSSASGSPIATLTVAMSDGSTFNGTLSATDGTGIVCSVSPCAVTKNLVTARAMSGTDDGSHTVQLTATANGHPFTQAFTLSVTAQIACDFGPNMASIPQPAQNAGFTHCALNADFTDASGLTRGGGWIMSNKATWLAGCGASGNAVFHEWFNGNLANPKVIEMPCNRAIIGVGVDPSFAGQVFDEQWLLTDYSVGKYDTNTFNWPGTVWTSAGGPRNLGLYGAMYAEITFRTGPVNVAAGTHTIPVDFWEDQCPSCNGGDSGALFVESDIFEADTFGFGGQPNLMNTHQPSDGGFNWGTDITQYHTVAGLITSSGSVQWNCGYIDGGIATATPVSCFQGLVNHANNGVLSTWIAADQCYGALGCLQSNLDVYIKSIRMFACSNYWNALCTGTLVTH